MWIIICLAILAPTVYSVYIFMGYFEKEGLFVAFPKDKNKILPNNAVVYSLWRKRNRMLFIPIADALRDENEKMLSNNQGISAAM